MFGSLFIFEHFFPYNVHPKFQFKNISSCFVTSGSIDRAKIELSYVNCTFFNTLLSAFGVRDLFKQYFNLDAICE